MGILGDSLHGGCSPFDAEDAWSCGPCSDSTSRSTRPRRTCVLPALVITPLSALPAGVLAGHRAELGHKLTRRVETCDVPQFGQRHQILSQAGIEGFIQKPNQCPVCCSLGAGRQDKSVRGRPCVLENLELELAGELTTFQRHGAPLRSEGSLTLCPVKGAVQCSVSTTLCTSATNSI